MESNISKKQQPNRRWGSPPTRILHRRRESKVKEVECGLEPRVAAALPLPEVRKRQAPHEHGVTEKAHPIEIFIEAVRNNLDFEERHHIRSLEDLRGGHATYDYVPRGATFIYRCPLEDCCNPHSHWGSAVNLSGLKRKCTTHPEWAHPQLRGDLHIRVIQRRGRIQHHVFRCAPPKGAPRRRYAGVCRERQDWPIEGRHRKQ